jgi:7-keto-8-aminopelargonate synthetase-like enzyme
VKTCHYGIVGPHPDQSHTAAVAPVDFSSNNNLSFSTSPFLYARVLAAFHSASTKGVQFLPPSCPRYLAPTFCSLTALPFYSDFDGDMGLFACVPLSGDTLLHIKATHALVHDHTHPSCIAPHVRHPFAREAWLRAACLSQ